MPNKRFYHGHALLIGAGADLPMTVNDARDMYDLLIDPRRAAYPPEQVHLLTEEAANRDNILNALDHLVNVDHPEQSTVIVYYSGHGGFLTKPDEKNGKDYYLLVNGCLGNRETCIREMEFIEKIRAIRAHRLLVILDCCHAAAMAPVKSIPRPGGNLNMKQAVQDLAEKLSEGGGRVILASCRDDQLSYGGKKNSMFTQCLIEVLEGRAPGQKDGEYVKLLTVLAYLFEAVPERTSNPAIYLSGPQHPFVPQITGLSDNFAICLIPNVVKTQLKRNIKEVSTHEKILRQEELAAYRAPLEIYLKKLAYFNNQIAILPEGPQKFHLEMEVLKILDKVTELKETIKQLGGQ